MQLAIARGVLILFCAVAAFAQETPAPDLSKLRVQELRVQLMSNSTNSDLARSLLLELGRRGTRASIKAIEEYQESLNKRTHAPLRFRIANYESPRASRGPQMNKHSECTDANGQRWMVGSWVNKLEARLWLCKLANDDTFDAVYPIPLPIASNPAAFYSLNRTEIAPTDLPGEFRLQLAETVFHFKLADVANDTDGDGYCDGLESYLGCDPASPDSDADGKPDPEDPFPTAAPNPFPDERHAILQAAFTYFIATADSDDYFFGWYDGNEPVAEFFGATGHIVDREHPKISVDLTEVTHKTARATASSSSIGCSSSFELEFRQIRGIWVITTVTHVGTACI